MDPVFEEVLNAVSKETKAPLAAYNANQFMATAHAATAILAVDAPGAAPVRIGADMTDLERAQVKRIRSLALGYAERALESLAETPTPQSAAKAKGH